MSTEAAIIQLIVEGQAAFDASNTKIQGDLTAMERASKDAEGSAASMARTAREAEQDARRLNAMVTKSIGKLSSIVGLADRAATAVGVDPNSALGEGIDVAKSVLGGAAQGASIGAAIPIPGATLVAAGVGGLVGLAEGIAKLDKKIDKLSASGHGGSSDIDNALLREAGLARIDNAVLRGGRQVQ